MSQSDLELGDATLSALTEMVTSGVDPKFPTSDELNETSGFGLSSRRRASPRVSAPPAVPSDSFVSPNDAGVSLTEHDSSDVPAPPKETGSTSTPPAVSSPADAPLRASSKSHGKHRSRRTNLEVQPTSSRVLAWLRSRPARVVATICGVLVIAILIGLNSRRSQSTSAGGDELADLALPDFEDISTQSARSFGETAPVMGATRDDGFGRDHGSGVETADWTTARGSTSSLGLVSNEVLTSGRSMHERTEPATAARQQSGAWLTGQIEVDGPTSLISTTISQSRPVTSAREWMINRNSRTTASSNR